MSKGLRADSSVSAEPLDRARAALITAAYFRYVLDTPSWTFRPTGLRGPDPNEDPWRDLDVRCDGKSVGRVHQLDPRTKRWTWAGQWAGENNRGTAPTSLDALNALRDAWGLKVASRSINTPGYVGGFFDFSQ